jgi:hypothetical protein
LLTASDSGIHIGLHPFLELARRSIRVRQSLGSLGLVLPDVVVQEFFRTSISHSSTNLLDKMDLMQHKLNKS